MEVYSSLIFSDTAQIFLDFMRRVFCRITNYAFYSPKGSFWEKFLFELCASQSRISIDNRWGPVAKNFSVGLWIQNFQIIPFQKKNLLECLSFFFWTVSSNFSDFNKTKMTGLPKFPSTVSEIFKGEKLSHQKKIFPSVFEFELKIFGLVDKKFGRLTKTAFYVSRGELRRKKFSN